MSDTVTAFVEPLSKSLSREQQIRLAILQLACGAASEPYSPLRELKSTDWLRQLTWLDTSGLALLFFDRVQGTSLRGALPPALLARLRHNLEDNTARMEDLVAESQAIQGGFRCAGVEYAVLKGFSLWPTSVPRLELRSQLDLDFLVSERSAKAARGVLEEFGYGLSAVSGRTWEFKAGGSSDGSLTTLYQSGPHRSVELHLQPDGVAPGLLQRTVEQRFRGRSIPVLNPKDGFVGQALHLFKHVCSEFFRASHLVEFRTHVIARYYDEEFWRCLEAENSGDLRISLGLGTVLALTTQVSGAFAPAALRCWTSEVLPPALQQWVRTYGLRSVLASFPGQKNYLLLQRELEKLGLNSGRSVVRSLLPTALPPAIAPPGEQESIAQRTRRYRAQLWFFCFRFRFHLFEGLRYLLERQRWERRRGEVVP